VHDGSSDDTNVSPTGSVSVTTTEMASAAPWLVTATV
jgi:hypothetical protein